MAGVCITRRRSPEDERNLLVAPTESGMALRERATEVPVKMAGCVRLTAEEAQALYGILYKLLGAL